MTLANEISHRIKNNLQVIVGLIAYLARWDGRSLCARLQIHADPHRGYCPALRSDIAVQQGGQRSPWVLYLREIANTMSAGLLGNTSGIKIEVQAEALDIDPDLAVPFGLLVNELTTNAIKHAFPGGTGRIVLSVERAGDQIELIVADDGIGMKEKDLTKTAEKRGSDYVAIFVRQLGGHDRAV